jgi:hypothetical protein
MKNSTAHSLISLFIISTLVLSANEAEAIPAFARKYRISCNTCHVAVPKLKEYGEAYAGDGFVLPDGEEPARANIDTGDESLLLMRELPIAVRFDAFIKAEDNDLAELDLGVPFGIKLLSGGRITKKISYYFYFYMDERGSVEGLEDAYLHFNNLGGTELDIMVGQFQVSDPLFKRELRLTFEDYSIYSARPGNSIANLTYDRGLMLTYSFDFGLDLVGEIVNGNGIGEAENRLFDLDSRKNFALRASQSFGPVRVGAFAYLGSERMDSAENEISYWGPDATVGNDHWELNVQFLQRKDTNPDFAANEDFTMNGGFLEFTFFPAADQSKWIFSALYNKTAADGNLYDYETGTFSLSHVVARNLRLLMEFTFDFEREKPRFVVGAVSAF